MLRSMPWKGRFLNRSPGKRSDEVKSLKSTLFLLAVMFYPLCAVAQEDEILALIKQKYAEIQDVVAKNPERKGMEEGIKKVMDSFVDYTELGRRTLAQNWEKIDKKKQEEFVSEFKKMIQRTYVRRFDPNRKVQIEYQGGAKKQKDGSFLLKSTVRSGRSEVKVDYLFVKKGGRYWAFDVIIDDVSMVKNYRKQFHKIWEKEGFEGLMTKMKRKNEKAGD